MGNKTPLGVIFGIIAVILAVIAIVYFVKALTMF